MGKRKRAARPAGAERRAQLNRSKGRVGQSHDNREIVDILLEEDLENIPGLSSMGAGGGGRRRGRSGAPNNALTREREFTGFAANGEVNDEDPDGLMRKLRAL